MKTGWGINGFRCRDRTIFKVHMSSTPKAIVFSIYTVSSLQRAASKAVLCRHHSLILRIPLLRRLLSQSICTLIPPMILKDGLKCLLSLPGTIQTTARNCFQTYTAFQNCTIRSLCMAYEITMTWSPRGRNHTLPLVAPGQHPGSLVKALKHQRQSRSLHPAVVSRKSLRRQHIRRDGATPLEGDEEIHPTLLSPIDNCWHHSRKLRCWTSGICP